jgi:hypothetical protein
VERGDSDEVRLLEAVSRSRTRAVPPSPPRPRRSPPSPPDRRARPGRWWSPGRKRGLEVEPLLVQKAPLAVPAAPAVKTPSVRPTSATTTAQPRGESTPTKLSVSSTCPRQPGGIEHDPGLDACARSSTRKRASGPARRSSDPQPRQRIVDAPCEYGCTTRVPSELSVCCSSVPPARTPAPRHSGPRKSSNTARPRAKREERIGEVVDVRRPQNNRHPVGPPAPARSSTRLVVILRPLNRWPRRRDRVRPAAAPSDDGVGEVSRYATSPSPGGRRRGRRQAPGGDGSRRSARPGTRRDRPRRPPPPRRGGGLERAVPDRGVATTSVASRPSSIPSRARRGRAGLARRAPRARRPPAEDPAPLGGTHADEARAPAAHRPGEDEEGREIREVGLTVATRPPRRCSRRERVGMVESTRRPPDRRRGWRAPWLRARRSTRLARVVRATRRRDDAVPVDVGPQFDAQIPTGRAASARPRSSATRGGARRSGGAHARSAGPGAAGRPGSLAHRAT